MALKKLLALTLGVWLGLGSLAPLAQASEPACVSAGNVVLISGPSGGCFDCGGMDDTISAVVCAMTCTSIAPADVTTALGVTTSRAATVPLAADDAPREWRSAPEPFPPRAPLTV